MLKRVRAAVVPVTFLLVLSACTMYSKPKKGFAGATGGEQLEKQFWDDIQKKDWKDLGPRIAPEFTSSGPAGARDRAAMLDEWKKWDLRSVSLSDVQVKSAGGDFIVTSNVTLTGTIDGQPVPSQLVHSMTVWQQVSKGFVAVAHSDGLL